jgi:hypothetical protein
VPGGSPESYRYLMPEYPPRRNAKLRTKRTRGPCESTILPQIGAEIDTPAGQKKHQNLVERMQKTAYHFLQDQLC